MYHARGDLMDNEEDITRLELPQEQARPYETRVRLSQIRKQRTGELSAKLVERQNQGVRVLGDNEPEDEKVEKIELELPQPHRAYEGKSIEYNVDAILNVEEVEQDQTENQWGKTRLNFPVGWLVLIFGALVALVVFVVQQMFDNKRDEAHLESKVVEKVEEAERETLDADLLVKSMDRVVKGFFAAASVEKKVTFVRFAEQIRGRMERYYAKSPLQSLKVRSVTDYSPLLQDGKSFWRVKANFDGLPAQYILVEQISESDLKIDWESAVDYQPMPWDDYVTQLPEISMVFRVQAVQDFRFFGEFADESRWMCFRLNAKNAENTLYGYILRDSPDAQLLARTIGNRSANLMLRLMASSAISVKNTVVIDKVISTETYRLDPPSDLND